MAKLRHGRCLFGLKDAIRQDPGRPSVTARDWSLTERWARHILRCRFRSKTEHVIPVEK